MAEITVSVRATVSKTPEPDHPDSPVHVHLVPGHSHQSARSTNRRWKRLHEQQLMDRLVQLRVFKKEATIKSRETAQHVARKIPVELLAKEWLQHEQTTIEARAYLIDKLLPILVLGVEKLLTEVQKRGLSEKAESDPNFNPINYLAHYLMRNNPRYSNFLEASPYVRGLREVEEELKKEMFSFHDNRLAKIKADVKRKREERERCELAQAHEKQRRFECLSSQFLEWNGSAEDYIELSVVQNTLRIFLELVESFPVELQEAARLSQAIEPTDEKGEMLSRAEFVKYVTSYISYLPKDIFDQFMSHLSKCAAVYSAAVEREKRRIILTNLFIFCDHSGLSGRSTKIGLLDRHRILNLFERFWDSANAARKDTLRNPRQWPVVEVDEAEEFISEDYKALEIAAVGDAGHEEDMMKYEAEAEDEEAETEKNHSEIDDTGQDLTLQDEMSSELGETSEKEKPSEDETKTIENHELQEHDAEKKEEDVLEKSPKSGDRVKNHLSVAFATEIACEMKKTGHPRQIAAFDASCLNVSQFVQLTETFLGDQPNKETFTALVQFIKEGYEETEEEKLHRLMKARWEVQSTKRKVMVDQLFEKWDNDGSGYLDTDEVEAALNKYKDGQGLEAIKRGKAAFKKRIKLQDARLSKREFRTFIQFVADEIPGADTFEYLVEFLTSNVERSYAERIRGEARKKWLQAIVTSAQASGASMEPVCRAVFQALYKDAEAHGGSKRISANIAMLERNVVAPERGNVYLRYVACTFEDSEHVLGKCLYRDMRGISYAAVDSGKPIHVPRVANHGNIQFWNTTRKPEEREGSFIAVPLKDAKKRVFGVLGIDTLNDPHSRAIFITHEIQFYQGVAKAFSIAYHHVDVRKKLLRITESAISWIQRRSPHVCEITVYLVEQCSKEEDFHLRKMMTTDKRGVPIHLLSPPQLQRIDNLFRDYLFKCVDNSETITADAYGERHIAFPLRDVNGRAVAVIDINIGDVCKLPPHENKETQRMLRLLQQAHREITQETCEGEKLQVLDAEKDEDTRMDIMFDRLMLTELRENVQKLDAQAYAELKSYYEPPDIIRSILKAVLAIFYYKQVKRGEFDDWSAIKMHINSDLCQKIAVYDPTAEEHHIRPENIEQFLKDVPHGEVAKHGSLPAEYLYNWVFVCLSLIEHIRKTRQFSDEVISLTPNPSEPILEESLSEVSWVSGDENPAKSGYVAVVQNVDGCPIQFLAK